MFLNETLVSFSKVVSLSKNFTTSVNVAKDDSFPEYLIVSEFVFSTSCVHVSIVQVLLSHVISDISSHDNKLRVDTELSESHVFSNSFSSIITVIHVSIFEPELFSIFHVLILCDKLNMFMIDRIHPRIKQNIYSTDNLVLNIFDPNILHSIMYITNDHAVHANNLRCVAMSQIRNRAKTHANTAIIKNQIFDTQSFFHCLTF